MAKNHRMIETALNILEYVALEPEGCTFTDIWEAQGIPKSTAHSIIQTLKNMQYFHFDTKTERFTLGTKAFEIGSRYITNNSDAAMYAEIVTEVSMACDETVHLGVLDGRNVFYLSKHDSSQPVRMISSVGKRVPAHGTALGKALLTGLSDKEISELYADIVLERLTDKTITDLNILIEQVNKIRVQGYSSESQESTEGIMCYAVPVLGKDGAVIMGISISVPIFRVENREKEIIDSLMEGKKKLERLCATKAAFGAK